MIGVMDIIGYLADLVFAFFYLRTSDSDTKVPSWRKCIGILILLCTYVLYSHSAKIIVSGAFLRYIIRLVLYLAFLFVYCGTRPIHAIYGAAFTSAVCNIVHNIFLAPGTNKLLNASVSLMGNHIADIILSILIVYGVKAICYYCIYRFIPLGGIRTVGGARFVLLVIVMAVSVYIKDVQIPITYNSGPGTPESSTYFIMVQAALLLLLFFYEKYQRLQLEHTAAQIQSATAKALIRTVKARQEAEESVRRVRHDLKNHLTAIRSLVSDGNAEGAEHYIDRILDQTASTAVHFRTGNRLLDTLLEEKLGNVRDNSIQLSVIVDFRQGDFIDDFDLCVIMGNALDNAIEACMKVEDAGSRFIDITGGVRSNQLIVVFSNSCNTEFRRAGMKFLTTKADIDNHGFGIDNITNSVEKFGGSVIIDSSENDKFVLTLVFPLPDQKL